MMSSVVIDASLIYRLLTPNPQQDIVRRQVDSWQQTVMRLVAPTLWVYELTSAIVKSVYAGHLTDEEGRRVIHLVHEFPVDLITPDTRLSLAAFGWSRRLQRASAYDAFYLALAEALQSELWTADRRLANAVQLDWVHCLGSSA